MPKKPEAAQRPEFSEPEHPDYQKINQIFHDGIERYVTAHGADSFADYLSQHVDGQSIAYIAMERVIASGIFNARTPQEYMANHQAIMHASLVYAEGFLLGVQFAQASGDQDAVLAGAMRKVLTETSVHLIPGSMRVDGEVGITPLEHTVIGEIVEDI